MQNRNYIVTQYPLPDTIGDFWSLIYDNDSDSVVVMESSNKVLSEQQKNIHGFFDHRVCIHK
jgi:protein tyrosine phosphatase